MVNIRGPDGKVHQSADKVFYSTLSLWDTYRAAHPMYTILCPDTRRADRRKYAAA